MMTETRVGRAEIAGVKAPMTAQERHGDLLLKGIGSLIERLGVIAETLSVVVERQVGTQPDNGTPGGISPRTNGLVHELRDDLERAQHLAAVIEDRVDILRSV